MDDKILAKDFPQGLLEFEKHPQIYRVGSKLTLNPLISNRGMCCCRGKLTGSLGTDMWTDQKERAVEMAGKESELRETVEQACNLDFFFPDVRGFAVSVCVCLFTNLLSHVKHKTYGTKGYYRKTFKNFYNHTTLKLPHHRQISNTNSQQFLFSPHNFH